MNADTNKLVPLALPVDVSPAPELVLRMIKYGCSASQHCSAFCSCNREINCKISQTINVEQDYENDDVDAVACDIK